jgi:hypothetical protein
MSAAASSPRADKAALASLSPATLRALIREIVEYGNGAHALTYPGFNLKLPREFADFCGAAHEYVSTMGGFDNGVRVRPAHVRAIARLLSDSTTGVKMSKERKRALLAELYPPPPVPADASMSDVSGSSGGTTPSGASAHVNLASMEAGQASSSSHNSAPSQATQAAAAAAATTAGTGAAQQPQLTAAEQAIMNEVNRALRLIEQHLVRSVTHGAYLMTSDVPSSLFYTMTSVTYASAAHRTILREAAYAYPQDAAEEERTRPFLTDVFVYNARHPRYGSTFYFRFFEDPRAGLGLPPLPLPTGMPVSDDAMPTPLQLDALAAGYGGGGGGT